MEDDDDWIPSFRWRDRRCYFRNLRQCFRSTCLGLFFFIPARFVSQAESFKQLATISFVIMLLPASLWWLFFFRLSSVKRQFQQANTPTRDLSL